MKIYSVLFAGVSFFAFSYASWLSGEEINITGNIKIPANSPLIQKKHPRLLFTEKDIPLLRARVKQPAVKADLELIDRFFKQDPRRMNPTTAAVVYMMTGKSEYLEAARKLMLSKQVGWYVPDSGLYAYDILYNELSKSEREAFQKKVIAYIKQPYRAGVRLAYALGIRGDCNDPVIDKVIREQAPLLNEWNKPGGLNWWAGSRGGDTRSFHYIHQNTMTPWANAAMCWTNSTGIDVWKYAAWAEHLPMYYLYHLAPGFKWTIHLGVNCNGPACPNDDSDNFFAFFAKYWHNGPAQWYLDNVVNSEGDKRFSYTVLPRYWGRLLWRDNKLAPIPPDKLPETRYFDRMGYVSMRSDWGANATMAHFQCGPFEIWDGAWGRNNADNNSFLILSRKGCMAADTGTRWGNNSVPSKHMQLYFNQTVAHNSITVGDEDVPVSINGHTYKMVRGGQSVPTPKTWPKRWGDADPVFFAQNRYEKVGRITAYTSTPEWTYASGDATRSYSPDYVKSFTRQFLYIRPDVFVVFDRVESVKPAQTKRWLLHTMNKPSPVDGKLEFIKPGYWRFSGDILSAADKGGRLFCRTFLPEKHNIMIIGGGEHRFDVDGINRDMPKDWYKQIADRDNFRERNTFGEWRMEVSPAVPKTQDVFLHLLQCADVNEKKMIKSRLLSQVETGKYNVGLELTIQNTKYKIIFHKKGTVGGSIEIGNESPVKFPNIVEDNYDRWKKDPRYNFWMTDPRMRSVIGVK